MWEVAAGKKVLVGARTDNKVYVLDDLTGLYTGVGNYPVGTVRELVDFGDPNAEFVIDRIEFELSSDALTPQVTVWLDPVDPENPDTGGNNGKHTSSGDAATIGLAKTKLGSNHYRAQLTGGRLCQRVLVEFVLPVSAVNGTMRGDAVYASKQPWPVNR